MWLTLAALASVACQPVRRPASDASSAHADAALDGPGGVTLCDVEAVPDGVRLHGAVLDAADATALPNALVDAIPGGNALSNADGSFAIDVPIDAVATPISLTYDAADDIYPLHRRVFQRPFDRADVEVSGRLHSYVQLDSTLYDTGAGPARDPQKVTLVAAIVDCSDAGVAGARFTIEPAPDKLVYFGDSSTTNASGLAYGLNVQAGPIIVAATGAEPFAFEASGGTVVVAQLVAP